MVHDVIFHNKILRLIAVDILDIKNDHTLTAFNVGHQLLPLGMVAVTSNLMTKFWNQKK